MKRDTPKYIIDVSKKLRKNQTKAEKILWEKLKGSQLNGYKFRRQSAIGRYIADFYCCKASLVIEVDGSIHDSCERKEYDETRQEEIEARGIKVIRFSNEEILDRIDFVLQSITEAITHRPRAGEGKGVRD